LRCKLRALVCNIVWCNKFWSFIAYLQQQQQQQQQRYSCFWFIALWIRLQHWRAHINETKTTRSHDTNFALNRS
jgi:hypothetical protein